MANGMRIDPKELPLEMREQVALKLAAGMEKAGQPEQMPDAPAEQAKEGRADAREIIDALQVCADDEIICAACPNFEKYGDATGSCFRNLMLEAAGALEGQLLRIEELEAQRDAAYDQGKADMRFAAVRVLGQNADCVAGVLKASLTWASQVVEQMEV